MPIKVLYLGGTGEVSYGCIQAGLELGQQISVYNRGKSGVELPPGAVHLAGDVTDETAYQAVARHGWDAVCQFRSFDLEQNERDLRAFAGHCNQFVFISTVMVYRRPPSPFRVTETAPRGNPHSDYARKKMAIEDRLIEVHRSGKMPVTIARPSHTVRTRLASNFIGDDHIGWRMLHRKPVISHGDGTSLWGITRTEDFGRAFAKLLGNPRAIGQTFHITTDEIRPWDEIFQLMARTLGADAPLLAHVPTDTLVRYEPKWANALPGDKSCSLAFDNSKVKAAVGGWECRHDLPETMQMSLPLFKRRLENFRPDPNLDALLDRIIQDQAEIGGK